MNFTRKIKCNSDDVNAEVVVKVRTNGLYKFKSEREFASLFDSIISALKEHYYYEQIKIVK